MSAAVYLDKVKTHLATYDRELQLDRYDLLNTAYEKTGQPRIYFVLAATLLGLVLLASVFGLAFLANAFAFYPLYSSFKALRTPQASDDQFWLTYWVVYGTLALAESLVDASFSWMPFYYLAKIAFMGWCFHPQTKGALLIYHRVLAPLFGQLQAQVEQVEMAVDSASKQAAVQAPGGPKTSGQRQSTSTKGR